MGLEIESLEFQRGYDAALAEIYVALDSDDHPKNCGGCRSCGVIRSVIEDVFLKLGTLLPPDDFESISKMIQRLNQ